MPNFEITFEDSVHGTEIAYFDNFFDAMDYWNDYADTETCVAGTFKVLKDNGLILEFDDRDTTEVM